MAKRNAQYYKDTARLVIARMLETRPKKDVIYRPYTYNNAQMFGGFHSVNLNQIFGRTFVRDYAFVTTNVKCPMDAEVMIGFRGADAYRLNGEWVYIDGARSIDEMVTVNTNFREGYNEVVFRVVAGECHLMTLSYFFAPARFPFRTTNDYTLCLHDTVPVAEYEGEYGFSVSELCRDRIESLKEKKTTYEECKTVLPLPSKSDRVIDFNLLYGDSKGEYALAYTTVKCDTAINIKSHCPLTVYVNGEKSSIGASAKAGDKLIVVAKKANGAWGFESEINDSVFPSEISSKRNDGDHWLLLGAFGDDSCPEIDFKKPYDTVDGQCYFRFADGISYLRPCLETFFYGQWFYALMIGQYGIRRASDILPEYYDYFKGHIQIMADYYDYMKYDHTIFREQPFLRQCLHLTHFDAAGTITMNLCDLYKDETDEKNKAKLLRLIKYITDTTLPNIYRLEDGTFYREYSNTLWADDAFMCNPFLVRVGDVTGDTKYYDEVVAQLKHYYDKLFMKDQGVCAHIYFPSLKRHNSVPWGRGNGWIYLAYAEAIEHLPVGYPGRDDLIKNYREMVEGLIPYQAESGLWRQVLNIPESYEETSGTAFFAISMAKMIKAGVIDRDTYLPIIQKAVDGIIDNELDESYNVLGVCQGSGCKDDAEYYVNLGTVDNDDHGTGVVIYALCEMYDLLS